MRTTDESANDLTPDQRQPGWDWWRAGAGAIAGSAVCAAVLVMISRAIDVPLRVAVQSRLAHLGVWVSTTAAVWPVLTRTGRPR